MNRTKLLIIDEDVAYREAFQELLSEIKDIEIVGTAPTAKLGLDKIPLLKPNVILASASLQDIPVNGLTHKALSILPELGVIITVIPNDSTGALKAIEALDIGAFDFLQKMVGEKIKFKKEMLKQKLVSKIRCFSIEHFSRKAKILSADSSENPVVAVTDDITPNIQPAKLQEANAPQSKKQYEAVLIGVSTGGPKALNTLLSSIPATFPVPIIVVLHMPKTFTSAMAGELNRKSLLAAQVSQDGMECTKGNIYLAQGGEHLTVEKGTRNRLILRSVDTPPENGCKPSVDVLFRSAVSVFNGHVLPIILTGMGHDGTKGLAELKKDSVYVIAQDKDSSVVWGMPGSAVKAGYVDEVLPLQKIASRIVELV